MSRSKAVSRTKSNASSITSHRSRTQDGLSDRSNGTSLTATQQLLEQRRLEQVEGPELIAESSRRSAISRPANEVDKPVRLTAHEEPHLAAPRLSTVDYASGPTISIAGPQTSASPWSDDASEVMTLDEFEQMAIGNHPSLAEATARVQAAQGRWLQAGLPPNFRLGYSGQQVFSGGVAEQRGLYMQQEFIRGRKLELDQAVAAQEVDKAQQDLAAQQQRVLTDVRLAYYNVLVAQRRNETVWQLQEIAQRSYDTAEALLRASEISQFNVMQTEVELQATKLEVQNATSLHEAAWGQLLAVSGVTNLPIRPLAGDLESPIVDIDIEQAMQDLIARSPELAAALEEVERARWAVDRACAEPIGNIDVQAIAQYDNSTQGANGSIQIAVPLPWRNRNQGGIRAAQAEVLAAEQAVDRLQLNIAQRLASVYQQYAVARSQVEQYSRSEGILDVSQRMLDVVRRGYEAGELEYRDLMLAQRNHAQKNLAFIEALGTYWSAVTEIDGLLLKDSLSTAPGGR